MSAFSKWSASQKQLLFLAIIFSIVGIIVLARKEYRKYQIDHYGVKTYAQVLSRYIEHGRGATENYVTITYPCRGAACNSDKYIARVDDRKERFAIGETLIILYSSKSPTNVQVIGTRINSVDRAITEE